MNGRFCANKRGVLKTGVQIKLNKRQMNGVSRTKPFKVILGGGAEMSGGVGIN